MSDEIPAIAYLDPDRPIDLVHDNLALSPHETARLLACLCERREVVSDEYLEGGAVEELESRMAGRLRKEAALYLPTGTLANHLALTALSRDGERIVVDGTSHVARDAGDGLARFAGRSLTRLEDQRAGFDRLALAKAIGEGELGKVPVPVGVITLETPMRRRAGEAVAQDRLDDTLGFARMRGLRVHLDCARAFIASAWTGVDPADLVAHADTAFVSLWKNFNAPSGAVLVGDRSTIEAIRPHRRAMGGAPRSGWADATIAMHFLERDSDPFERAREAGDRLIERLESDERFRIERVPNGTHAVRVFDARSTGVTCGCAALRHADPARNVLKANPTLIGADLDEAVRVARRVFR